MRAVLVDAGDLCSGTSGASSRLIHGGIRYLEHGEVRLVHESLRERERLLRAAPHLLKPYPLLVPFYRHNRRSRRFIRTGMIAYDLLSLRKTTPRHRILSRTDVVDRYPGLDRDGLTGAVLYVDAQVPNAERLGVELAVDAGELGAAVHTHWAATSLTTGPDGVLRVGLRDGLTRRCALVRADTVVNCAGPWVDEVLALTGYGGGRPLVRGSKGTHLLVRRFAGAPDTGVHYEARSDGRAVLVLPTGDGLLIGATDTFIDGDPGAARCTEQDVDYLLAEANALCPHAGLTAADVVRTYCGVRPLPYSPHGVSTAEVSRDHHVTEHPDLPGLFSVVGGKLTTHRALGELVVARIAGSRRAAGTTRGMRRYQPRSGHRTSGRSSRRRALPGGRCHDWQAFAGHFRRTAELDPDVAERLLGIYGVRAGGVLRLARAQPGGLLRVDGTNALAAEVRFAVEKEFARTLIDIMARRMMLSRDNDLGLGCAQAIAELCRDPAGWDSARAARELQAYRDWITSATQLDTTHSQR